MIYPAFLVGMVLLSLMVLLIYVVPQFAPMFQDMNIEMPLITPRSRLPSARRCSFWYDRQRSSSAPAGCAGRWPIRSRG